jgi:hypothetical protein
MGSMLDTQVIGQFMHPLIDADTKNYDPWQRNYFQPPQLKNLVPRTYPLIDIRPSVSDPNYVPAELLKSHGFGVVKHNSALLAQILSPEDLTEQVVSKVYHPEIKDLVMKTTGAKQVFILATVFRRGKSAPEEFKMPTGLNVLAAKNRSSQSEERGTKPADKPAGNKSVDPVQVHLAAPVRIPHMDFTPVGARQTIRAQQQDIYNTAVERGVIAAEDKICQDCPFLAQSKESEAIIAERYNLNGMLGPRYAAYSVWRPLQKVGRDPLALAPWKPATANDDLVYWPYENKIPGCTDLGGDFLKEFAMLGVKGAAPSAASDGVTSLKWYYLSEQEPDEVLIIKLVDSAALGKHAQDAGAPWHASPEIGVVEDDHSRESIELRVLAFW